MARRHIYKPGSRHRLNNEVNKENFLVVDSNLQKLGYPTMTALLDKHIETLARKVRLTLKEENGTTGQAQ